MTHPQFVSPGQSGRPLSTVDSEPDAETILEQAQSVLEDAQADIEEAKTDLIVAEAGLDEASAELEEAEEELTAVAEEFEYEDVEQLRPGDLDELAIAIWDPEVAERYRDAWRDIQAHFVDEPEAALGEAQDLVAEAVQALADALLAEQVSLDPHDQFANPDTESMRVAMRGYRDFLERVLSL